MGMEECVAYGDIATRPQQEFEVDVINQKGVRTEMKQCVAYGDIQARPQQEGVYEAIDM